MQKFTNFFLTENQIEKWWFEIVERLSLCCPFTAIQCTLTEDCKCSLHTNCATQLPNSMCDSSTDSCVCTMGFFVSNGQCVSIDSKCHYSTVSLHTIFCKYFFINYLRHELYWRKLLVMS